jgi:hypothetical protein
MMSILEVDLMAWVIVQSGPVYHVALRLAMEGMSTKFDHYLILGSYSSLAAAEANIEARMQEART